ncbi:GDNF family receptor alpha-2 [Aulostomus maculatus]
MIRIQIVTFLFLLEQQQHLQTLVQVRGRLPCGFMDELTRRRSDVCVCDPDLDPPGWREPLDCVRASEICNQNSQCSSRYRIMRQCLSGGDRERSAMLASKECQGALGVLQDSPLYDCRCKRGMKKELQCLQNYWSIHMGLTEGEEFYETSPYEPIHFSDDFRHASIISDLNSTYRLLYWLTAGTAGALTSIMTSNHDNDSQTSWQLLDELNEAVGERITAA